MCHVQNLGELLMLGDGHQSINGNLYSWIHWGHPGWGEICNHQPKL